MLGGVRMAFRNCTQAGLSETSGSFQLGGRQGAMPSRRPAWRGAGIAGSWGAKGAYTTLYYALTGYHLAGAVSRS